MQSQIIRIEQLKPSLELLNQIYDIVRIVHPLKKHVISFQAVQPERRETHCYDLWEKGKMCNNCISIRAYQEKETHFKLEHIKGKIYMILAVPVQDDNELMVLELLKDITHTMMIENFLEDDNHPMLKLLNEVGQLQIKDALTGILNRRFIDERLPVDIHNSIHSSTPFTLVMADIDHFKNVNDTYGHVTGDYILKEFAKLLQQNIPKNSWVARYGGEEFLIGLLNFNRNEAEMIAEKLRSEVENNGFVYENNVIKITSSFGVCTLDDSYEITMEEMLECTDRNLYQAKNSGRNCVVASKID